MVAHVESLPRYLGVEGTHAALKLLRDVLAVRSGETVVITNDSSGDHRVSALVAGAAQSLEAIPIELNTPTAQNAGADPPEPVAQALYAANVWVELSRSYILNSATQRKAQEHGVRYICLTGVDVDTLVRTVGRVDLPALYDLGQTLADLTNEADQLELTCASGSHLVAQYAGRRALAETGSANSGAVLMLGGQTNIIPLEETVSGPIVFNGSVWPPDAVGILNEPLSVRFDRGWATIDGTGWQASRFREWLEGFNDRNMFRFSHFSYGYNPGVLRPSGRVAEDERVFGCVCIGLGSQTMGLVEEPLSAPSHTDLTILRPTIRLGDQIIEEDGRYVHPDLVKLCRALGAPGY